MEINPVRTINKQFFCHRCNTSFKKIYNPEDTSTIKCTNCGSDFVEIVTNSPINTQPTNPIKEDQKTTEIPMQRQSSINSIDPRFLLSNLSHNAFVNPAQNINMVQGSMGIPFVQEVFIQGPHGSQHIRTVSTSFSNGNQNPIINHNYPINSNNDNSPERNRACNSNTQNYANVSPHLFRIHAHNPVGYNPPRTDSMFSFGSGIFGNVNQEMPQMTANEQSRQNMEGRSRRRESNRNILHNEFPGLNINSMFNQFSGFGFPFFNSFDEDDFHSNLLSNFRSFNSIFDFIGPILEANQEARTPPVNREYLAKIPVFNMSEKYCKKNEKGENEFPVCSICCTNFALEDKTMLLPCGHMFHPNCITPWFKEHNSCPVCRFQLPTDKSNQNQSGN